MTRSIQRLYYIFALFTFALILSSCGKESDPCDKIDCPKGECRRGICINPSTCETDDVCLDGFACNDAQVCEAVVACNDETPCPVGSCNYGACINPEQCDADEQCLPGFECDSDFTCVESLCANVDCERGICNVDSGECVNEEFCTDENEAQVCIDGYYCYAQRCQTEAQICGDIDCERGVCDPAQKACVDADSCTIDDECLDGSYCDDGTCTTNQCDADMTECPRGVCDPDSAECVNADTCSGLADCTDGFYCIDSACVDIDEACGADGCPGNQICDFDASNDVAFCDENPDGCTQARDCNSPRVCNAGRCAAPSPCTPDALEPNDSATEATLFTDIADGGVASATLCSSDSDFFTFNSRDTPLFTGTLVVDVRPEPIDVGIADIEVRVLAENGTEVGTSSGDDPGAIIVDVGALLAGNFTIEVTSSDTFVAGIDYSLSINFYDDTTAIACQSPVELTPNSGPFNTNTTAAQSFELGSSCTNPNNMAGERIFSFTLAEESYTEVLVDPSPTVDLTVSIREECLSGASEVACASRAPVAANETLGTVLPAGQYFIIVQGPDQNAATGSFSITLDAEPTICSTDEATCLSPTQSQVCNARGTGYDDVTCTGGCDMTNGRCVREPSDVCFTAIDVTGGYVGQIDWSSLTGDYNPATPNCIPRTADGSESSGPDAAFTATVQPDEVLIVDLTASGEQVSLYAVENCGDIENTCVAAANASTTGDEQLIYFNQSGGVEQVYLIADVLDSIAYQPSDITVQQLQVTCQPGTQTCSGDDSLTCDETGTSQTPTACAFGCSNGICNLPPNDSCATALDLISLGAYTAPIAPYNSNYDPGFSGCTGSSATGGDAVFDVTGAVGEVVTVDVSAAFDAALYVVTDCADVSGTCTAAAAESTFGQVEFLVEAGETYYAIVDSDSNDTGDYTVRARSQQPSCVPGTALGCVGATELEYCSPLGVPTLYSCDGSCSNGACDNPRGTICADPIDASRGFSVVGQDFDSPNTFDSGVGTFGACTFTSSDATVGSDRVHKVDLLAGDTLIAEMDSGSIYGTMYLLEACGDFDTCVERTPDGSGAVHSITYTATQNESVYLYTDRTTSGTTTLDYDLDVRVTRPCTIGSVPYCDVDGQTVVYCDGEGFEDYYSCDTSCTAGRCDNPVGESCFDPIQVSMSGTFTGDFDASTGSNDIEYPVGQFGGCFVAEFDEPDGPEEVYSVDLSAGDTLTADLQTTFATAQLFIMQSCTDPSSCQANNPEQGATSLNYRASATETVFVVVDSSSASSSVTYSLDLQITPGLACPPNTWECDPSGNAALCNGSGTNYSRYTICDAGCTAGFCDEDNTAADTCTTAPNVSPGTRVASNFADLTNDISLPSSSCVGTSLNGPDYIQAINVSANDIIRARVESYGFETSGVYIFSDCADAANSCVEGALANSSSDYTAEAIFRAPAAGTYFVAADSSSTTADQPFSIAIDVLQPQCTPGTQACVDATTLQYCDSNGLFAEYTCSNGCSGTACSMPDGETCFEPVVLTSSTTVMGDFGGTNSVDFGDTPAGGCFTDLGSNPDGGDDVYAIDLAPGDVVTADLNTSYSSAYLYISKDCADRDQCVVNNPLRGAATLSYQATSNERVFLIVDATSVSSTEMYTLDVTISQGLTCAPDTWSCEAGAASLCDSSGASFASQATCATGCSNGFCEPILAADSCATAPDASGGVRVVGNFDTLTNDISMSSSSCVGTATASGDLIYAVNVQADEIISARTVGYGGETTAVYIFTDCGAAEATCLAGDDGTSTEDYVAETLYRARTAGTYYVAADGSSSGWDEPFALEIDILQPECSQGQTQCAPDGVTLQYCDPNGLFADYNCPSGCSAGACTMPSGDTCLEPIAVSSTSSLTGDFNGTDAVNYGSGNFGACFADDVAEPDSADTVYEVALAAGETVTAQLTTTNTNAYLFLMGQCLDSGSCQANNPGQGDTTLSYRADGATSVFVVVDSSASSTATYTLDFTITGGLACAPDRWVCDGGDAKLCDSSGASFTTVATCPSGCSNGFCDYDGLAADTCGSGPTISGTYRTSGTFEGPTNNESMGTASCVGSTASAGDYFYAVQANAGDVIHAEMQSFGDETTTLYVFDDCLDPERSCSEGARGTSTEDYRAVLDFQAPTTGTYYLAADGSSSVNDEPWTLFVDVQPGACTIGDTQCDAANLQYCDNGSFTDYTCSATCNAGACDSPTGDICFDAIAVASSGSYSGSYSGQTNGVDPANGSCEWTSTNRPDGPDTVYEVSLAAGDILTANLTTTASGASLYVLESCTDATQSCVWAEPDSTSLQYYAQTAGTYYVVVDTDTTGVTDTFTLDLSTASGGVCQPGEITCDSGTGTITECASDGLSIVNTTNCPESCSPVGRCTGPATANDTCADAYAITAPVSLVDSYSRFNDNVDPGSGTCIGEPADGPDAIYSIFLNANDVLIASVTSQGSFDDAALYVVTDCNSPGTSCLDGEVSDTTTASVGYLSPVAQQVYLVVDSDSSFDTDDFYLDVDFGPAQCSPGQVQCADANTLEYCNDLGRFETYPCQGGCAAGACGMPQSLVCADAQVVTDGTTVSDSFVGSNDIDLGGGAIGACDFSTDNTVGIGDDHFYAVDMTAGETLTVTYTSPGASGESASSYGFVFVMSDCYDGNTCLANITRVSSNTTDTLTYTAQATGRYYVVVDRSLTSSASTTYGYTVTFGVQ